MPEPTVTELFDLTDRVVLITGATGYLGSAMSRALAEAGATVIVSSRDLSRAQQAASKLPNVMEAQHFGVMIDHKDDDSIRDGFQNAVQQAGQIDILINNAQGGAYNDLTDVSGSQFRDQLANAAGYFLLAREFRNHVVANRSTGSLIFIGSMYGIVGSYPEAYAGVSSASPVAYHALKGGVIHMTRHLAVYWAGDGLRVNCLSPGPFPSNKANAEMVNRLSEKTPMKRMGKPDELKGAILFLASDASSYMTGQNLVIDGGWTAW